MGSEGYLLNQFLSRHVNQREDRWGGPIENRMRFAVEIVKAIREKVGEKFIICFRLSMLDLVHDGNTMDEVITVAIALEKAGINFFPCLIMLPPQWSKCKWVRNTSVISALKNPCCAKDLSKLSSPCKW